MMALSEKRGASELLRGVLVLAAICLASGLGVGLLYVNMKSDILANERQVFENRLRVVLGRGREYQPVGAYPEGSLDARKIYAAKTGDGVLYAATGSAQGYQSEVTVLVSVRAERAGKPVREDATIHRLAVVSSQETPGLGENVNAVKPTVSIWGALSGGGAEEQQRPWFQEQFEGKTLEQLTLEPGREGENIEAMTGATITSRATTKAAREAFRRIMNKTEQLYGEE